jgi:hypothetical protein
MWISHAGLTVDIGRRKSDALCALATCANVNAKNSRQAKRIFILFFFIRVQKNRLKIISLNPNSEKDR